MSERILTKKKKKETKKQLYTLFQEIKDKIDKLYFRKRKEREIWTERLGAIKDKTQKQIASFFHADKRKKKGNLIFAKKETKEKQKEKKGKERMK